MSKKSALTFDIVGLSAVDKKNEVYELYIKAMDAWAAVPKMSMLVDRDDEAGTDRYYCGECGADFHIGPMGWSRPSWSMPIFCCGKLLI